MASLVVTLMMRLIYGILEQDTLVMSWEDSLIEIRSAMSME